LIELRCPTGWILTETLATLKRAPKYVRRAQAEWMAAAERALRG
jgi:hypothetical protein